MDGGYYDRGSMTRFVPLRTEHDVDEHIRGSFDVLQLVLEPTVMPYLALHVVGICRVGVCKRANRDRSQRRERDGNTSSSADGITVRTSNSFCTRLHASSM